MDDEGSQNGRSALAQLASDLGIGEAALKSALDAAYDLMKHHGNASLSFHIALARMGYKIDGPALYARLSNFRRVFASILTDARGRYNYKTST